ncbi:hypothetical protein B5X24_HaOG210094 [Helicoverpa armigera]|nr:hypothetical protein B5X24_HaOG210094 [Helicoverpa armigera]
MSKVSFKRTLVNSDTLSSSLSPEPFAKYVGVDLKSNWMQLSARSDCLSDFLNVVSRAIQYPLLTLMHYIKPQCLNVPFVKCT